MPEFEGRAYSPENPRQFENLLIAFGDIDGQIKGTAVRIITQAEKNQNPDAILGTIKTFKELLADRLTLGAEDSIIPSDSPEFVEWRKELNELYRFFDDVRHGLRIAKQRVGEWSIQY